MRHAAILRKYRKEIMPLLVPDKPYTIIVALCVISVALANCYWARVRYGLGRTNQCGCWCWTPT